ncbi:MAG: UDP-N-acetylmuramate dehydrogenase [Gammaproteobacteria bacterium]|nr:UDP-N-acetylmuramate dehydrogenase [Gammaproteobacteria bacterium]
MLIRNHKLAPYTTWNIGGPAAFFFQPDSLELLQKFLCEYKDQEIFWLGAGSNILVSDKGFDGVIIYPKNILQECFVSGKYIEVGASVSISTFLHVALKYGLTGCEFMVGIPGTIGGALFMNAGAHGGQIWDRVSLVRTIDKNGSIHERNCDDFVVSYRRVINKMSQEWFLSAKLRLDKGDSKIAIQSMREFMQHRIKNHPCLLPSCGSVFRNPKPLSAAQLIESAGLKGLQIGGAQVSPKHANFIVNLGNATANDVLRIIDHIKKEVYAKFSVELETEVKFIGDK